MLMSRGHAHVHWSLSTCHEPWDQRYFYGCYLSQREILAVAHWNICTFRCKYVHTQVKICAWTDANLSATVGYQIVAQIEMQSPWNKTKGTAKAQLGQPKLLLVTWQPYPFLKPTLWMEVSIVWMPGTGEGARVDLPRLAGAEAKAHSFCPRSRGEGVWFPYMLGRILRQINLLN